jgi:DnaK suppressor protein
MARQRRPLSDTRLRAFREGLVAERAQLVGNVEGLDAEADVKNWRESGFDDDPADAGSASFERETAQSLSLHARNLLAQIEDALRRLDEGTFGDCIGCGCASSSSGSRPSPTRRSAWTADVVRRRGAEPQHRRPSRVGG